MILWRQKRWLSTFTVLTKLLCLSPEPGTNAKWQWGRLGWMLADHTNGLSCSSFFSWILDSSVGLSAGILSAGDSVPETLWVRMQRKTTCLLSIRKSLACARASKLTTTNMILCSTYNIHLYIYIYTYIYKTNTSYGIMATKTVTVYVYFVDQTVGFVVIIKAKHNTFL